MKWPDRFRRRHRLDDEIRDEMDFHLRMRADRNEEAGMSAEEARRSARRQFGNSSLIQEEVRRMNVNAFSETIVQDLHYALRGFRRAPAFTLSAILAIALGIGATTAVFSVVDLILFRRLPYAEDQRLVSVGIVATPLQPQEFMFGQNYLEWKLEQRPFESLTTWSGTSSCDLTEDSPARLSCARIAADFLPTLGVSPMLGRQFTADEDQPDGVPVAMLTFGLWQRRFGGDARILERSISIDGKETRIAGVLPEDFETPTLEKADVFFPQALRVTPKSDPGYPGRLVWAFGRLKAGVTPAQAQAQLQPLFEQVLQVAPPNFRKEVKLRVRSIRDRQISDVRTASWALFGSVLAVLLIACANVANLMLARSAGRQRELAVRVAIGASRARLIRQTLTESLLLAAAGGAAGAGLAHAFLRLIVAVAPEGITRLQQASIDPRVLVFTAIGSLTAGLLFGLAPALQNPSTETLTGSRGGGQRRQYLRHALVAAQIAVSLVLLTGAGLLLRTLWNLQAVPLGIAANNLITASVVPGRQRYPSPGQRAALYDDLERRLRAIPGVTKVASADSIPPGEPARSRPLSGITVEGRSPLTGGTGGRIVSRLVSPDYFSALDIPIVLGRAFREEDQRPGGTVVILSETLSRRLFPNEDPIGKRISFIGDNWAVVCGVAADVKNKELAGENDPEFYALRKHDPDAVLLGSPSWTSVSLIVRSMLPPDSIAGVVRSQVAELDPALPVTIETMTQRVSQMTARPRFNALLLGLFAGVGVLLAAIGLYGVMSFLVAQRTQEIGVRMAIGATRTNIMSLVLARAARWISLGVVAGLGGSLWIARSIGTLLYQVSPADVGSIGAALAVLVAVAFAAAWLPARRATRVDPLTALRHD